MDLDWSFILKDKSHLSWMYVNVVQWNGWIMIYTIQHALDNLEMTKDGLCTYCKTLLLQCWHII